MTPRDCLSAAEHGFPFYVYALSDEDGVFYVGKGKGRRMWAHKATDPNGAKGQRIAQAGGSLRRDMIAFFRDESSAFAFERELIAQGRGALTNIVGGIVDQRTAAARRAAVMLSNMVPLDVWLARAHRDRIEAAGRLHPDGAAGFYMESRNWLERMAHA